MAGRQNALLFYFSIYIQINKLPFERGIGGGGEGGFEATKELGTVA